MAMAMSVWVFSFLGWSIRISFFVIWAVQSTHLADLRGYNVKKKSFSNQIFLHGFMVRVKIEVRFKAILALLNTAANLYNSFHAILWRSIKLAAKKGDNDSAKILAKEVVHARKSVAKIYTAKANLGSVEMQIKQQVSHMKISKLFLFSPLCRLR